MEPPVITRHRRPFLAPLYLGVLAAVVFFAIGWAFYDTATTTVVFLVRPVEKNPGTIDDPPVSPEGEARAERVAHMFGDEIRGPGRLDGIYESEDRRAEQTAAPLIERMHRAPVVFGATGRAAAAHQGARPAHFFPWLGNLRSAEPQQSARDQCHPAGRLRSYNGSSSGARSGRWTPTGKRRPRLP